MIFMALPCNRLYDRHPLDRPFLAGMLGISEHQLSIRLHKLKRLAGLRRGDRVVICMDDGETYASASRNLIGCLHDP